MTRRRGHSLPELIVAVTFLGIALGCVGASSVLGAQWAGDALRRQAAVRVASAVLDSLIAAPVATTGYREDTRWRVAWSVEAAEGPVRVTVDTPAGQRLLEVDGWRALPVPVIPAPPAPTGTEP